MNTASRPYFSPYPVIQICECEQGHLWTRVDPVWADKSERRDIPTFCPDHAEAREEIRRAHISERKRAHDLRVIQSEVARETSKKCNGPCGKWKDIDEFGVRRYRTRSNVVRNYPRPWCKECDSKRQDAYRARQLKEDPEGYRSRKREASSRNNHKRRARQRARRIVDSAPLREWLREFIDKHAYDAVVVPGGNKQPTLVLPRYRAGTIGEAAGLSSDWMSDFLRGKHKKIPITKVDAMLTFCQAPHMLSILYPLNPDK